MNKEDFLSELKEGLSGLPNEDIEERLLFYSEMIDDRVEEGVGEIDAIAQIGSIEDIISQTIVEVPLSKLVKEKIKPKRKLRAWEITLIILGFPVWFSLLIALGTFVLSFYAVIWSLVISMWAIEASLLVCPLASITIMIIYFAQGNILQAIMMLGSGLIISGLAIFMFFGCIGASRGIVKLTKNIIICIKSMLIRKEKAK